MTQENTNQDLIELLAAIEKAADKALTISDKTDLRDCQEIDEIEQSLIGAYEKVATRINRLYGG